MVSAGDLQHRFGGQEDSSKRMAPGLLIGCHVDASTGLLRFTINGKDVANKFQVEPGAMLFPAVFCEPTNKEMFQFELGRMQVRLLSRCFCGVVHINNNGQKVQRFKSSRFRGIVSRVPSHFRPCSSGEESISTHSAPRGWTSRC